ncbi:MAG: hypothetical protein MJZ38_07025 [archaeon]|nr:hypothetical protein [archaeon]
MTAKEALDKYRSKVSVEHLVHSLKRVTGLKPLRVWKESSIRGSVMLALLSENAIAMARYELKPRFETKMEKGKLERKGVRLSTESMVWSLSHLTITRIIRKGLRKKAHYSNWDPISIEVFNNIHAELGVFG